MEGKNILLGILRICLGWVFLWSFFDKLLGLGFTTKPGSSWLDGTSPTFGFLKFATKGPLADFYQSLAGNPVVDWFFMAGLILIGLSLTLGIFVKIATWSGALMLTLMFTAGFIPPEHNPLIDDHIIYAVTLLALSFMPVGDYLGFGHMWKKKSLVRQFPWLE